MSKLNTEPPFTLKDVTENNSDRVVTAAELMTALRLKGIKVRTLTPTEGEETTDEQSHE